MVAIRRDWRERHVKSMINDSCTGKIIDLKSISTYLALIKGILENGGCSRACEGSAELSKRPK